MMRIFVSYAGEQRNTAESIAVRLRQAGHRVFLDKDDLPPAQSYDDRIRQALVHSHLFVFLVSPESVRSGAYALTELGLARDRWPNPSGHVLPVMAVPTPYPDISPYLAAVTVLEPKGLVAAETADAVRKYSVRRCRLALAVTAVVVTALAVGVLALWHLMPLLPSPDRPGTSRTSPGSEPTTASGWFVKGLEATDPDEKVRCFTQAIRLEPDYVDAYYERGVAYYEKGKFDRTLADCSEAIRLKPDYADAYYTRAAVLEYARDYRAALADYEQYLHLGGGQRAGNQVEVEGRIRGLRGKLP